MIDFIDSSGTWKCNQCGAMVRHDVGHVCPAYGGSVIEISDKALSDIHTLSDIVERLDRIIDYLSRIEYNTR